MNEGTELVRFLAAMIWNSYLEKGQYWPRMWIATAKLSSRYFRRTYTKSGSENNENILLLEPHSFHSQVACFSTPLPRSDLVHEFINHIKAFTIASRFGALLRNKYSYSQVHLGRLLSYRHVFSCLSSHVMLRNFEDEAPDHHSSKSARA